MLGAFMKLKCLKCLFHITFLTFNTKLTQTTVLSLLRVHLTDTIQNIYAIANSYILKSYGNLDTWNEPKFACWVLLSMHSDNINATTAYYDIKVNE